MLSVRRQVAVFIVGTFLVGCNATERVDHPSSAEVSSRPATFTDVTNEAGLGSFRHRTGAFGKEWFPETVGSGCAFIDYDGDGLLDILLVAGGTWDGHDEESVPALELYRNLGGDGFRRATEEAGLASIRAYGFGLAIADYDNDGDPDVLLTTLRENLLFRNDGAVFTEVGRDAGVADHAAWSTSALFFDADADGFLDLYVGNYVPWSPETDIWCTMDGETKAYCTPQAYAGEPGRYYHNNGDGTFTEQTAQAGFTGSPGKTLGVAELDANGDHLPDLVVANDTERDLLYENQGDGTFLEVGVKRGVAYDENGKARAGMGIDAGDVDNSGRVTIMIGHFSNEMAGFYRSSGDYFVDYAAASGIGRSSLLALTFGLFLFDADLDGYLDAFTANGHISEDIERVQDGIGYRQRSQLFINQRDGRFIDATDQAGTAFKQRIVARGAAYGDYDRDGDQDILITENGGRVYLWKNEVRNGTDRDPSFVRVRLEGRRSNRDGHGSRVTAVVDGMRITRRVRGGSSYLSHSETTASFGLGGSSVVDTLEVRWPSGTTDVFTGVRADQEIQIVEGSTAVGPSPSTSALDPRDTRN